MMVSKKFLKKEVQDLRNELDELKEKNRDLINEEIKEENANLRVLLNRKRKQVRNLQYDYEQLQKKLK